MNPCAKKVHTTITWYLFTFIYLIGSSALCNWQINMEWLTEFLTKKIKIEIKIMTKITTDSAI